MKILLSVSSIRILFASQHNSVVYRRSTPTLGKLDFRADTLAPGAGNVTHIFELVVTDNNGARSEPVSITVTVTAGGGADAGSDQTVDSGATVTLDGSGIINDLRKD